MKFNHYTMTFYEKLGCMGNKKQKELLQRHGIVFHTQSILDMVWTKEMLEPFFDGLDIGEIINPFAPQIKSGEIDINDYCKEDIVALMCTNPILIKRPLLQINQTYICGFDICKINACLGVQICEDSSLSTCQKGDECISV